MASSTDIILFSALLVITVAMCSAVPGHIHEKYIIHAPVKFRTVHHYKVHKIPVVIKKHIHHHKYLSQHTHHFDPHPVVHDDHPPVFHDDHSLEMQDHHLLDDSPHGYDSFESNEHYYR